MDPHAVAILEFDMVRTAVAELCLSPAGAARIAQEPFLTDSTRHGELLRQVSAVRALLAAGAVTGDADLPEVADVVALLRTEGRVMEPEAAARLGRFLRSAAALRRGLRRATRAAGDATTAVTGAAGAPAAPAAAASGTTTAPGAPTAAGAFATPAGAAALVRPLLEPVAAVEPVPPLVFRVVDSAGAIRERELPTLAAIAGRIQRLEQRVAQGVRHYLTDNEYRPLLTGDRATERGGRTVIPVRANSRGRIRGIVHETSASGATLFVEPEENIQVGNRIVEQRHAYRRELHRIMRELTVRVAARQVEIDAAVAAVAAFDAVLARARYAVQHRCAPAATGTGSIDLRAARHPLLGAAAVPLDLRFGGARRVLIVTGPNTGGKTVALKTIGLLALMNQFGMEVSAAAGSVLPLFDRVLADIGDEQSIAQSLSTFSGHVRQLAHISGAAGDRSLVLLDELGAGTDPEEGIALAMAVLDRLLEQGPLVAATTHHGALKNYGYLNPAVENASMEFDAATLRPTFRLMLGVPGDSHALEIAARQGLAGDIVAAAERYLGEGRTDAAEMIRTLTAREAELHRRAERHARAAQELRRRDTAAAARERELAARERALQATEMRELRAFLRASRSRLEGAIRELRERTATGEGWREPAAAARAVVDEAARLAEDASDPVGATGLPGPAAAAAIGPLGTAPAVPAAGARVRITATGRAGTVVRSGRRSTWVVETGSVRGTFTADELEVLDRTAGSPAGAAPRTPAGSAPAPQVELAPDSTRPVAELNVRGQRVHEALPLVERQLDAALLAGLHQFSILHGKGEGILRHAIHRYLEHHRAVVEFGPALPHLGGDGKTMVTLG